MSLSHRRIATALLSASLVAAPVGVAAADPSPPSSPTSSSETTTPPPSAEPSTGEPAPTTAPVPTGKTSPAEAEDPAGDNTTSDGAGSQAMTAAADLTDPAGAGADWLVGQLVGDHFATTFDGVTYPDQGLTADGALALAASGGHDGTLGKMVAYLFSTKGDYTGQAFGEVYAGSLAKLALVATVTGQDPQDVEGQDLLGDLLNQMRAEGTLDHGRFSDAAFDYDGDGQPDDYSNSITQSLAILALSRAGEDVPGAAVDFLVGEQCADGGFPSLFPATPEDCASDPDATGFVVQALERLPEAAAAVDDAVAWLDEQRLDDGSWEAEGTVNATALAAQGLLQVGQDVTSSVDWLAGVQDNDGWLPINPDGAADARATTQAVMLLAGETLGSVTRPVELPVRATETTPSGTGSGTGSQTTTEAAGSSDTSTTAAREQDPDQPLEAARTSGSLPVTGGVAGALLPAAAVLLALGALLLVASRRRTAGAHRG